MLEKLKKLLKPQPKEKMRMSETCILVLNKEGKKCVKN